ncbi:MAG TPA: hypothetical protein VIG47_13875, partial [Gemmatimonadaceae bacterium]
MNTSGNNARGPQRILEIERRLERGLAGVGGKEVGDALAAIGLVLLVAEFQPGIDLDSKVGVV